MITAENPRHKITRNSSCFKKVTAQSFENKTEQAASKPVMKVPASNNTKHPIISKQNKAGHENERELWQMLVLFRSLEERVRPYTHSVDLDFDLSSKNQPFNRFIWMVKNNEKQCLKERMMGSGTDVFHLVFSQQFQVRQLRVNFVEVPILVSKVFIIINYFGIDNYFFILSHV